MDKPRKTQPKYSSEVRDRAVRLVFDQVREHPSQRAAIAAQIGPSAATLYAWVRQAERARGLRPALSSEDRDRIGRFES
jgi:transposase-like protein